MKNYEDKLFVGNIFQRTMFEGRQVGEMKFLYEPYCWLVKENVVLYKTKNGGYVEITELKPDRLFASFKVKKIDKVEVDRVSSQASNGLTVLPAVSLDDVSNPTKEYGSNGVLGWFVDSDSLISYDEYRKNQLSEAEPVRKK